MLFDFFNLLVSVFDIYRMIDASTIRVLYLECYWRLAHTLHRLLT